MFLGEDIGHAREYSEDTSKIIDDEVDRMLRDGRGELPGAARAPTARRST